MSAVLVQVKGWQRSFQPSIKRLIAAMSSLPLAKVPRRIAWRVMIPEKISTMFIHDPEVGVKCNVIRGLFASQAWTSGCLVGVVVIEHHVQLTSRVGLRDLTHEDQELGLAVPLVTGISDLAGRDVEGGEQGRGAVTLVVVGGLLRQPRPQRQDRSGAVQRSPWAGTLRRSPRSPTCQAPHQQPARSEPASPTPPGSTSTETSPTALRGTHPGSAHLQSAAVHSLARTETYVKGTNDAQH